MRVRSSDESCTHTYVHDFRPIRRVMHDKVTTKPGKQPSYIRTCMTSANIFNNPLKGSKQTETCRLDEKVNIKTKSEKQS